MTRMQLLPNAWLILGGPLQTRQRLKWAHRHVLARCAGAGRKLGGESFTSRQGLGIRGRDSGLTRLWGYTVLWGRARSSGGKCCIYDISGLCSRALIISRRDCFSLPDSRSGQTVPVVRLSLIVPYSPTPRYPQPLKSLSANWE